MKTIELKRKLGMIWPCPLSSRKIILLYHSVGQTKWGMALKKFQDQINWLSDFTKIISLTDLIQSTPTKNKIQVAITFDDGYQTLYDHVAPLFLEKKIPCTVYVNTGWISSDKKTRRQSNAKLGHYPNENFLIWDEVKALQKNNWEIGSHGVNHLNFTLTNEQSTLEELSLSKKTIENYLGESCLHFSYPWGKHSSYLKNLLRHIGYQYAASASHGVINEYVDRFLLPRINISNDYNFDDFKKIVQGKWDFLKWIHRLKGF